MFGHRLFEEDLLEVSQQARDKWSPSAAARRYTLQTGPSKERNKLSGLPLALTALVIALIRIGAATSGGRSRHTSSRTVESRCWLSGFDVTTRRAANSLAMTVLGPLSKSSRICRAERTILIVNNSIETIGSSVLRLNSSVSIAASLLVLLRYRVQRFQSLQPFRFAW